MTKKIIDLIKAVMDFLAKIVGPSNERFFGLLLFLALMFTLWVLYTRGLPPESHQQDGPKPQQSTRIEQKGT